MAKDKSVLLYNLYPLNYWKQITDILLSNVVHNDIFVHINIPKRNPIQAFVAHRYLRKNKKVRGIYYSLNFKFRGESVGFEVLRKKIDFRNYDFASYIHSKGSSRKRKDTQPIKDWTELLRYFVVERLDLAVHAFEKGYCLYGVNISEKVLKDKEGFEIFPESKFLYQGNFVTINLKKIRNKFLASACRVHYYGLEMFWGSLCSFDQAYSAHQSTMDHYQEEYPPNKYKTTTN